MRLRTVSASVPEKSPCFARDSPSRLSSATSLSSKPSKVSERGSSRSGKAAFMCTAKSPR